jgi:hypothetical protein
MPVIKGELTSDQGGAGAVAVVEDLKQVAPLFLGEGGEAEIVKHQQLDLGQAGQEFEIAAVTLGEGEVAPQPGQTQVLSAVPLTTGLRSQGAGEPRFRLAMAIPL